MKPSELDSFTQGYVLAALWTSDPNPGPGDYTENGLSLIPRVKQHWIAQAIVDCHNFQECNQHWLCEAGDDSRNGHDFWLTRNYHGAGFWDRGYPDEIGDALTVAAHAFGETYLDWECDLEPETEEL